MPKQILCVFEIPIMLTTTTIVSAAAWFIVRSGYFGSVNIFYIDDSKLKHQITEVNDWFFVTEIRRREYHTEVCRYYEQRDWFVRPVFVKHNYNAVNYTRWVV